MLQVDGLRLRNPQQSAKGYVGAGGHQARLMWGTRDDSSGAKVYYLEGRTRDSRTYRRVLRDDLGLPIGDSRTAETRARQTIRYGGADPAWLERLDTLADRFEGTWFDYVIKGSSNQTVIELARDGDYVVRAVFDQGTTALQPASVTVKSTLYNHEGERPGNVAVRIESMARTRVGTSIQSGVDRSQKPIATQLRHARAGEPIVDIISVNTDATANTAGLRAELSLQASSPARLKAVARNALVLGGSVTHRTAWLDPVTMERFSIEIGVVAKGEASIEAGLNTQPSSGLEAKREVEVYVRWIGPHIQALGTRQVAGALDDARRWAGDLLSGPEKGAPGGRDIVTRNYGSVSRARYVATLKQTFGTPAWQLVEAARGKNFGQPGLDLANRVNRVLHAEKALPRGAFVETTSDARDRLVRLWAAGSIEQRQRWAAALANPLDINFGLPELDASNARRLGGRRQTAQEEHYRELFLRPGQD